MNILITGAGRGIGYDTARQLAATGNHRLLVLSRNEQALSRLKTEVQEVAGPDSLNYLTADLNALSVLTLEAALRRLGGLDVLINNAGILINKPFEDLSLTDWKQSFDTNFFAVVQLIRICLPFFPASGGHIVNIGSMGGVQGSAKFPGLAAYSAAKAALANLTECLAEELKDRHIAVNCLSLGAVQTEMLSEAFPGYQAPVSSDRMADFMAWFALNGQHFFNGKILPVAVSTP